MLSNLLCNYSSCCTNFPQCNSQWCLSVHLNSSNSSMCFIRKWLFRLTMSLGSSAIKLQLFSEKIFLFLLHEHVQQVVIQYTLWCWLFEREACLLNTVVSRDWSSPLTLPALYKALAFQQALLNHLRLLLAADPPASSNHSVTSQTKRASKWNWLLQIDTG